MTLRLSVTIIGAFSGASLDANLHVAHRELLAVAIDGLVLADDTPVEFAPVYGYLAFTPASAPLGYLWQVGDRMQVTGRLGFCYEYHNHQQYADISRLSQRARTAIALTTRHWLDALPPDVPRGSLLRTVTRYESAAISFSDFQTRLTHQAASLRPTHRNRLALILPQQCATMRHLYAALDSLTREHPLITQPTRQHTLHLMPGATKAVHINRRKLDDSAYRAALLATIAAQSHPQTAPLPMDPPPATPPRLSAPATQALVRTPAPPPVRAQLLATLTAATTLLTVDAAGAVHPLDALTAAVEQVEPPDEPPAAPATRHTRKKAAGQESVLEFNGAWPTVLAFDAALIRLQPSLGQRAAYTGTLRLVRVVAPSRRAALRRSQDRLAHRLQQTIDRHLTATGAPRLAAYRQLTARLIAGRLSFVAYCRQLAALTPNPDPQLAARQQAAWTAFIARLTTLTAPMWVLTDITANTAPEDGVMMPLLAIDAARLPDAAYRHALFTRWRTNAAAAVQQDFNTGS